MAEKLCALRKKGGKAPQYTETSLWTNPSPSADFANQTITLSEGMSNFKYLAVKFKALKGQTDSDAIRTVVSVEDFGKIGNTANTPCVRLGGANSTGVYSRAFYKASDTSITITNANATNTQATANSTAIPLEILGINELAQGTVQTATGTFTRGSSTATVECGFEPSFVMIYKTTASSSSIAVGDAWMCLDKGNMPSYVLSAYKSSTSTGGQVFTKYTVSDYINTTSTGFTVTPPSSSTYQGTYRYIAIGLTTE